MTYVKRDVEGNIQAISFVKSKEFTEALNKDHEVSRLISAMLPQADADTIASDLEMIRVVEDLIDTLVAKSVISLNDLPQPVQLKLLKRKNLRTQGVFNTSNNELINL